MDRTKKAPHAFSKLSEHNPGPRHIQPPKTHGEGAKKAVSAGTLSAFNLRLETVMRPWH